MYLIFDTETTGLPRDWNAPITDLDNWPRLVQLAWQIHDKKGELIEVKNFIVKPEGFTIPFNAEKIHGISTKRAEQEGVSLEFVLKEFANSLEKAEYVVGHNVEFDNNIVGAEYLRKPLENGLWDKGVIDTKDESTEYCAIPGGKGGKFKWPTLTELHQKLFEEGFDEAHNASADVEATTRCFLELVRLNVISNDTVGLNGDELVDFNKVNPDVIQLIGLNIQPYQETDNQTQVVEESVISQENKSTSQGISDKPFVHLHGHSQFSVLQSTVNMKSLMSKAKSDNMTAVGLTDQANMYGVFRFVKEAHKAELKPIVGCEFFVCKNHTDKSVKDNGHTVVLIAKNKKGYHNLAKLCSISQIDGFYYVPRIDRELIEQYKDDLIALSGGLRGPIADYVLNVGDRQAEEELTWWKSLFKDDFYLELMRHGLEEEDHVNKMFIEFSSKYDVKVVATNNYFYLNQEEANAHDILLCIKDGEKQSTPIGRGRGFRYGLPNDQYYFRSQDEMRKLFHDIPSAIENISEIVDKIEAYKLEREVLLPEFGFPKEFGTEDEFLKHITYVGAKKRYPEITPEIKERIDFELETIKKTGYPGYFLIVQDFTTKAREMNVSVGPGRGSAAGSAVAYCIGITNVDPIKYDLLFERFLNPDRVSLPDIDIDFDDVGRSKIIDYVIEKYGKTKVAQIITYGTMAAKSSIRDSGRVLDLPLPETDRIAKLIPETPGISLGKAFKEVPELEEIKKRDSLEGRTLQLAEVVEGSVRNTGIHACGVIITPIDITDLIPVSTSKDSDLLVTQYDNSVVEDAGLLKMDFLGLKTLTIIKDAIEIIRARHGVAIDPDEIPLDDPKTYELYQKGETNGTFQFESAGMQKHLRALKPDAFADLIAMNALYRPGPIEYIPNFIARKNGKEEIAYDLPEMEEFLKETYGITVYQEQVMRLSQKLANFSKGDADLLRKAMGKKIKALLDQLKPQFIEGCKKNGHDEKIAGKIWKDWEAFAAYAFNKSHSTCYSVVAFHTAYLKANYPAEYMAAVLTNNMNDIKKVTFFMEECRRANVPVLGPDINESYYKFAVNPKGEIRFGLGAIKGLGGAAVESIVNERKEKGKYKSIFDVVKRIDLRSANKKAFESMTLAGAFDSFGVAKRSQYFYEEPGTKGVFLERIIKYGNAYQASLTSSQASLFGENSEVDMPEPSFPKCEDWGNIQKLSKEKAVVGVYISGHPLDDYKLEINNFCNSSVTEINNIKEASDKEVQLAGIVTSVNHRMTKSGKPFGIFTIEDYDDSVEIALFSSDYVNFKNYLNEGWFLYLKGRFQKKFYREDEFEFKIQQMELLQDLRTKLAKSFLIKINLENINENLLTSLEDIFEKNPGKCTLKILVVDDEEGIKITMPSKRIKINPSNELIEDLDKMKIPFRLYQT